ncbi:MAG: ISAs1 family transposase [Humibacillus sp.]|nr:ISAs1 family transposase [Humibacillus sp.]
MSSSPITATSAGLSRRPLTEVFATIADPRKPRGVRHGLATVLTIAQCAVLTGAKTLLAVHKWAAEADREALSQHGIHPQAVLPSETTIRRTLALVDAAAFDRAVAAWMAIKVGDLGGRRVIEIDGKTMRGARRDGGAPQLVAALDHGTGAVLGQLAVSAKSNEIPALRDLRLKRHIPLRIHRHLPARFTVHRLSPGSGWCHRSLRRTTGDVGHGSRPADSSLCPGLRPDEVPTVGVPPEGMTSAQEVTPVANGRARRALEASLASGP